MTLLLALWMLVGLFIDVWAHGQANLVESFFTPWHAIFYSGFLATTAWILWPVSRMIRRQGGTLAGIPVGYRAGAIGVLMFAVGGMTDAVWHSFLGIERGINVLMSPPHLFLFIGLILIVASPFMSAWARPRAGDQAPALRVFLPTLLSLTFATCIVALMIIHLWGFTASHFMNGGTFEKLWGLVGSTSYSAQLLREAAQHRGVSNIIISNLVLLAPVLLVLRRWHPPFGSVIILLTVPTFLMAAVTGFLVPSLLLVPLVGGLAADGLIAILRPSAERVGALRAFATLAPLAIWGPYFLVAHVLWRVAWPPELWAGVILWTGLSGLALSLVAVPSGSRP